MEMDGKFLAFEDPLGPRMHEEAQVDPKAVK